MTDTEAARLDALEIRVAHQDAMIEDLNATITAQWRQIDALSREVAMLAERLNDVGREPGAPEPPPPHY